MGDKTYIKSSIFTIQRLCCEKGVLSAELHRVVEEEFGAPDERFGFFDDADQKAMRRHVATQNLIARHDEHVERVIIKSYDASAARTETEELVHRLRSKPLFPRDMFVARLPGPNPGS